MKKLLAAISCICLLNLFAFAQKPKLKRPVKPKQTVTKPTPTPPVTPQATPTPAVAPTPVDTPKPPTPAKPQASVFGADEVKNLPSAETILARYFKADGTEAVKDKLKTRVMTGNFEIMGAGISGTIAIYQKAPNLTFSEVELPQLGNLRQGFDGEFGWAKDGINGLRNLNGGELSQARIGAQFNPKDGQKFYGELKVKGVEKVGERDAYVVIFTVVGGSPITNFFDTETGLLLRADAETEGPQGAKLPTQTFYSEYKNIDGVQIPHFTRVVNPAFTIEMKFYQVKHNIEVDDKKFQRPAN